MSIKKKLGQVDRSFNGAADRRMKCSQLSSAPAASSHTAYLYHVEAFLVQVRIIYVSNILPLYIFLQVHLFQSPATYNLYKVICNSGSIIEGEVLCSQHFSSWPHDQFTWLKYCRINIQKLHGIFCNFGNLISMN